MTASTAAPAVVHDADTAWMSFMVWERDGQLKQAMPGGDTVPYDAAAVHAKLYRFAEDGEIRVIRFDKGVRLPPSQNPVDTLIYTVSGRRVWFVDDQARETTPGDSEFHPKGVRHHVEALEGGIGMEFVFPAAEPVADARTAWIPAGAAPQETVDGRRVRTFQYGPRAIREVSLSAGQSAMAQGGALMLVLAGQLEIAIDGVSQAAGALDAVHLAVGATTAIKAATDSVWIESTVPKARLAGLAAR